MKIILNGNFLKIDNSDKTLITAGSINYYKVNIISDEIWKDLTKIAIIIKDKEKNGIKIPIINDYIYIDQMKNGKYKIGIVGYKIENDKKTYQISTNLQSIYFNAGSGEIKTIESESLELNEWEKYIKQIEDITNNLEANNVKFEDGETFQDKYNKGELQGPQGPEGKPGKDGSINIEGLTPDQKNELKGPQGEPGPQGEQR